ncbi:MAG: Holliday junction resolvase RuvX [Gammaproteobacteria bacterium]|nr:Holliday junction resolvase RuvX [Gammaproteobacteria bacterium]
MSKHHIILGFDFGLKNIGVAVGQTITQSANPLAVLKAKNGAPHWDDIKKLIIEWGVDALVVGLPIRMDGTDQPITHRARAFAVLLQKHFQLPVYFSDERLTTVAAKEMMHATVKGAARFDRADSMSAKLIVESWMNGDRVSGIRDQ